MQLYSFTKFNFKWLFAYKMRFEIVCGWRRVSMVNCRRESERKKRALELRIITIISNSMFFLLLPVARSILSQIRRIHPDYNDDRSEKARVFLLDLQRTAVLNEVMCERHRHHGTGWKLKFDWSMEAISSHWLLFYVLDERCMMEILGERGRERTTTSIKTTNWMCRTYLQLTTHGRNCNFFR